MQQQFVVKALKSWERDRVHTADQSLNSALSHLCIIIFAWCTCSLHCEHLNIAWPEFCTFHPLCFKQYTALVIKNKNNLHFLHIYHPKFLFYTYHSWLFCTQGDIIQAVWASCMTTVSHIWKQFSSFSSTQWHLQTIAGTSLTLSDVLTHGGFGRAPWSTPKLQFKQHSEHLRGWFQLSKVSLV